MRTSFNFSHMRISRAVAATSLLLAACTQALKLTKEEVADDYAQWSKGELIKDATVEQLSNYLVTLTDRKPA